jgi:hypothetical protein
MKKTISEFAWIEYEISGHHLFIHDVHVEKKDRNAGIATREIAKILYEFPNKTGWITAVSKPMDRVCEKLGFVKVRGKGKISGIDIPRKVSLTNANIWKKQKS